LGAGQRSGAHLSGFAVLITKSHLIVPVGDNVLFLDDAFIKITPKINQRLVAAADRLDVDDPFFGVTARKCQFFLCHRLEQFGAKDFGERLVIEQVAGWVLAAALGAPQAFVRIDGRHRHHQMHMRVIIEAAGMGVQHRDGAGFSLKLSVVLRKGFDRLPATTNHQVIQRALLLPGQRSELFRQREGQQKIRGGHLPLQLPLQPLLTFVLLAVGTVAMAAGMRHETLAIAVSALRQHHRTLRSAAVLHGGQRLALAGQKPALIRRQKFGFEGLNDSGEQDHLILPPVQGKAIHQGIDHLVGILIRAVSQMGIAGGGEDTVVAEDFLHFQQIDTGFDQMGGVAMPQTVWGNLFFRPQSWATWRRVVCTPPRSSGVVACCAPFKPP